MKDIAQGFGANLANALRRQPQTIGRAPHQASLLQECFELLNLLPLRRGLLQGICSRGREFLLLLWRDIL
jgi:hypothetical protein